MERRKWIADVKNQEQKDNRTGKNAVKERQIVEKLEKDLDDFEKRTKHGFENGQMILAAKQQKAKEYYDEAKDKADAHRKIEFHMDIDKVYETFKKVQNCDKKKKSELDKI